MPNVSIIVPTYNSEKFLRQCLDSAVNQTLSDIEIIVVDANSCDDTLKIVADYQANDSRIKLLNHKQEYLGASRNAALNIASGEYVMFLDSDDWLELNACEVAYNQAFKHGNDFAYFSVYNYDTLASEKTVDEYRIKHLEKYCDIPNFEISNVPNFVSSCECWYKIYKTSFLNDNNIRFYADGYTEDINFFFKCVSCSKSVSVINEPLYNYRRGHVSASVLTANAHWNDQFIARQLAYEIICASAKKDAILKSFLPYAIDSFVSWYLKWKKVKHFPRKKYYYAMQEIFLFYVKNHRKIIEEKKDQISNYKFYKHIIRYNWKTYNFIRFLGKVFSVTNDKRNHKVVNVCGLKLKLKMKRNFAKKYEPLVKNYNLNLERIKNKIKNNEKIRVAFYVNDTRWKCQSLFEYMQVSEKFEPFVLLGLHAGKDHKYELRSEEEFDEIAGYYRNKGIPVYITHDYATDSDIPLETFKPDIIFYLSPWGIRDLHNIKRTSKFALSCYIPYFVSNSPAWFESNHEFHNLLWKYYVINEDLANEYRKTIMNKRVNIVSAGHPTMDEWLTNDEQQNGYVIYAPHWSLGNTTLKYATFDWNGRFILEYAKKHPEFKWIFKPHPNLRGWVIEKGIIPKEEIDAYYAEWEKIATHYEGPDYIRLFKQSKALITDCGSFLAEYLPSEKPVILLRAKNAMPYNFLGKKVTKYYYKVHNIFELKKCLNELLENGEDPFKQKRLKMLKNLKLVTNSASNIVQDLLRTFN